MEDQREGWTQVPHATLAAGVQLHQHVLGLGNLKRDSLHGEIRRAGSVGRGSIEDDAGDATGTERVREEVGASAPVAADPRWHGR
jgi:hypothetical protein